jgi:hypothetical protein
MLKSRRRIAHAWAQAEGQRICEINNFFLQNQYIGRSLCAELLTGANKTITTCKTDQFWLNEPYGTNLLSCLLLHGTTYLLGYLRDIFRTYGRYFLTGYGTVHICRYCAGPA